MRVVIAPDSFSGTMRAAEAADAMAAGWRSVRPDDDIVCVPMADGGLGTLEVVAAAHPDAVVHTAEVADARGIATEARWLALPDGTGLVEVAELIGLDALAPEHQDPLRTTTYGVGQLLMTVAAAGVQRIVVGLGGSATVDGGAGMISSLTGHGLRRADGNAVKVGGRWVCDARSLDVSRLPSLLPLVIASDVTNPLLGPAGAATVFGPQKGADQAAVAVLEGCLARLADVVESALPGGPWRDRPGAGAAGGLGFALMALLHGQMASGATVVASLVGLDAGGADVVITGEGSLDAQTSAGKAPRVVADMGRAAGARTGAVVGRVVGRPEGFDAVVELGEGGRSRPQEQTRAAAADLARRLGG